MKAAVGWVHAAVFGALWGALEMSVGTALHLGRIPLRGSLMAAAALVCLVTLRRIKPLPGLCLVAGSVAVVMKVLALGGVFAGPLIGIALTAVVVEVTFLLGGCRMAAACFAGVVVLALNPLQMLVMTAVVAGPEAVEALTRGLAGLVGFLGFGTPTPRMLLAGLVSVWMVLGSGIGTWAWWVAGRVARRLGDS